MRSEKQEAPAWLPGARLPPCAFLTFFPLLAPHCRCEGTVTNAPPHATPLHSRWLPTPPPAPPQPWHPFLAPRSRKASKRTSCPHVTQIDERSQSLHRPPRWGAGAPGHAQPSPWPSPCHLRGDPSDPQRLASPPIPRNSPYEEAPPRTTEIGFLTISPLVCALPSGPQRSSSTLSFQADRWPSIQLGAGCPAGSAAESVVCRAPRRSFLASPSLS